MDTMDPVSMLMQCPPEIREMIFTYAFEDHPIYVCDARLKRSIGGPHRPANRRLPGLVHANKQIYKEAIPVLARQATLVFSDYLNFAQLASVVPESFAQLVRRISLRGDVVPAQSLERFSSLQQVSYQQLGNCFFVPTKEKGFAKRVSTASKEEVLESVLGRSASLVLIQDALRKRVDCVTLLAMANMMTCHEQIVSLSPDQGTVH
jgi:hypothetical protein